MSVPRQFWSRAAGKLSMLVSRDLVSRAILLELWDTGDGLGTGGAAATLQPRCPNVGGKTDRRLHDVLVSVELACADAALDGAQPLQRRSWPRIFREGKDYE